LTGKYGGNLVTTLSGPPQLMSVWDDMVQRGEKFSTSNSKAVIGFSNITNNTTKDLILKFSDEAKSGKNISTLSDFLNDCGDDDFVDFINLPQNERIVKTFVSHKPDVDILVSSAADLEKLLDDIDDLPFDEWELVRKWSFRSGNISNNLVTFAKASKFERVVDGASDSGAARARFIEDSGIGQNDIVEQVSFEIDGLKVRIDYLGKRMGKYFFGDAKFSTTSKNWVDDWKTASTENQKIVYPKLIDGNKDVIIKATDPDKILLLKNRFALLLKMAKQLLRQAN